MSKLSIEKIRYLAALGLAGDQVRIGYYVAAMKDPFGTVRDTFRRDYAADVLDKILDITAEDNLIYDHIVAALTKGNPNRQRGRPWLDKKAWEAIENKALNSGITSEVLLELYNRSYNSPSKPNLSREQNAFNAINSYIAKGKAWRDNPDLRLWGTDSLAQIYRNDTPYQPNPLNNTTKQQKAFETIKKVIKK